MGKVAKILFGMALLLAVPAWCAETAPPGTSAQNLLQWLEESSGELAAAQHDAAGAQQRADAAGTLPDPSVRIEWADINGSNPTLDPARNGQTMYKILQPIPGWGKRDAQKRAADAEAVAARQEQRAVRAGLRTQVKQAFARYYRAYHALQLNQELSAFADTVAQLAQSRYETGLASQQEMIRAQLEQSDLQTERFALQAEYSQSQARINALLNRPAHAELQPPEILRPIPQPAVLNEEALDQRLRDSSPELARQTAQVESAESKADLASRNRIPDLMVGVGPTQRGNTFRTWSAMLEFTIPLHGGARNSEQHEAEEKLAAGQARRQASEARLLGDLRERFAALQAAQQQEELDSHRALPLAELAFKGALAGYRNGRVDFSTLLEAKRQVQKVKLDELDAQVVQQASLAEIEQLIGEDL